MGGVCAKNDAGKAASDVPGKPIIKRGDKQLASTQKPPVAQDAPETKWITAEDNFVVDKGIELKADDKAAQVAAAWVAQNPEWEYTGEWKNEQNAEQNKEVSSFEVRKIVAEEPHVVPILMEESKMEDQKRPEVLDQKQSFVDQVSEGLVKKVSSDRFKTEDEDEEKKNEATTAAATVEQTKDGTPTKEQQSPEKKNDSGDNDDKDDAPVEEEQKADDATGPEETDKPDQEEAKEEPAQEAAHEDAPKAEDAPAAEATKDVKTDEKESDVADGLGAEDGE